MCDALRLWARIELHAGDLAAARAHLERALSHTGAHRQPISTAHIHCDLGEVHRRLDDRPGAARHYRLAVALLEAQGADAIVPRLNLGLLQLHEGAHEAAQISARDVLDRVPPGGHATLIAGAHAILVCCAAAGGDPVGFERHLSAVEAQVARGGPIDGEVAALLSRASELARERTGASVAARLASQIRAQ